MKIHYLACAQQDFGCQNGHISGGLVLVICGAVAVICLIGIAVDRGRRRRGLPPLRTTPRPPGGTSPFTASLLSGSTQAAYKPRGVTALTPSGVRVRVTCPHLSGHRTPDLAVRCGQAEKARIEKTGW